MEMIFSPRSNSLHQSLSGAPKLLFVWIFPQLAKTRRIDREMDTSNMLVFCFPSRMILVLWQLRPEPAAAKVFPFFSCLCIRNCIMMAPR